jgi:CRP-like cAMP-binding protein
MALLTHETRSANVVAETPAEMLALDFEALERIRMRSHTRAPRCSGIWPTC